MTKAIDIKTTTQPPLTQERLREVLELDDATDTFRWKFAIGPRVKAGSIAGHTVGSTRRRIIRIDGRNYNAENLANLWRTGEYHQPKRPKGLTQARLKELLHYNPETGVFTWLEDRARNAHAGDVAGCANTTYGYRHIRVDCVLYRAARLAHLWMTGEWPKDMMDHLNNIRSDDRWANLRAATPAQNGANIKRKPGKTGYVGVKRQGKDSYVAALRHEGTLVTTAPFDDPSEAAAARYFMVDMLCGEFAKH